MNLGKNIKITKCLDYDTGSAVREGATLDMQGFDGVLAIMHCADIHNSAVGDLHFETATQANFSSGQDLANTAIAVAGTDDDDLFVIDLYRPQERWIRAVVTKDTSNTAAESVVYVQYTGRKGPIDNTEAGEVTYELNISPDRGTK